MERFSTTALTKYWAIHLSIAWSARLGCMANTRCTQERYTDKAVYKALTAIAGMRVDYHNLGGWQASPRLSLKYNLSSETRCVFLLAEGGVRPTSS
ncbi:MAG: hypothetical protein R2795_02360 [Saprospiraceae bacterium]